MPDLPVVIVNPNAGRKGRPRRERRQGGSRQGDRHGRGCRARGLLEVDAVTAHGGWRQLGHLWSLLRRGDREMPGVIATQARTVEIHAPRPPLSMGDSCRLGTSPASITTLT
ncbi:MAG: hypothetical protein IT307_19210 [Chloroflexi bacterium]|nr:hypothetical protein [Chloroflexota bacterium]